MTLMVWVQAQIIETNSGQTMVDVFNRETVQVPGPIGPVPEATGELFAKTVERLADDVKERAMEQARDCTR